MKNNLKTVVAFIAMAVTFVSCSKNEDATEIIGVGALKVEFENGFKNNSIILGAPTIATSQNEILSITELKYLVSNIVLTKTDGLVYTYPKNNSYFIVNELTPSSLILNLTNVPAGDYKTIKFGIGVDQDQYNLGASGQGNFWTAAQAAGMTWSWAAGYKFLLFEGTFTSSTVPTATSFMVHTGKSGSNYNYTDVTLQLTNNALVRTNITPTIHLKTDVSQVIDGSNKISLSANNAMGMGAMIMGGTNLTLITANLPAMFSVDHVHNDSN